jgi:predicted MFS family arabinose efflux permease
MMGAFDLVGTTGSGWLSDRFDNRWLLFWYYGLRGLSLLYLPFTTFNLYGLSLFAVFYGLDWIATVPPTLRLTIARFGRAKANVVFGWIARAITGTAWNGPRFFGLRIDKRTAVSPDAAGAPLGPLDGRHLARDSETRPRQAAAAQRPSDKSAVVPLHGGERRS